MARGWRFAAVLLALCALRHYGYKAWPTALQADAQNVCTALMFIAGVGYIAWHQRGLLVLLAVALWAAEELQVAGCSVWVMLHGAPASVPGDQCTGILGFDLGRVGIFALAILAHLAVKAYRSPNAANL